MAPVVDATSAAHFEQATAGAACAVAHFWAPWAAPCAAMDVVFARLVEMHPGVAFLRARGFKTRRKGRAASSRPYVLLSGGGGGDGRRV